MADLIKIKGGNGSSALVEKELAYHTAEEALYIGTKGGNKRLCGVKDVAEINIRLDELNALIDNINARLDEQTPSE